MSISDLYNLKSKYSTLKSNILNIIEVTKNAISSLEIPSEDIKKYYTKNDIPVDNNILKNIKNELIEKNNHLVNVVVKNITTKINDISAEIAVLEEIERKQREAAQAPKSYSSQISFSSPVASKPAPTQSQPRVQKSIRVSTN